MGRRLYYGRLLHAIRYWPDEVGKPGEFVLQLIIDYQVKGVYEAATYQEIVARLKADGYQIWGSDPIDYYTHPSNAWEYVLMESYLKQQGYTDDEVQEIFAFAPLKENNGGTLDDQ